MYHTEESDHVSAKVSFPNSHHSKIPAKEAVSYTRCKDGVQGEMGLASVGLWRIHAHYRQVNFTENLTLICRHKPVFTAPVRVLKLEVYIDFLPLSSPFPFPFSPF